MNKIIAENARRNTALRVPYNPTTGEGCCGDRVAAVAPDGVAVRIPAEMARDAGFESAGKNLEEWERLRCRYDFEFWASRCATIHDKRTKARVKLVLNRAQRKLVAVMESQRRAGKPIRVILLKARQWGGSTVTQMYMAWMQTVRRENWHSVICAQFKDTAAAIRGMYTDMLRHYPRELWEGEKPPGFSGFEGSQNTRLIEGRGCRVSLGSSERQEALRGFDFSMAHLSEVAYWRDSAHKSPEEFIGAILGCILNEPETLIVLESTANGVGNYFHDEWLRSRRGESDKEAVFVPWYEIDLYRSEVPDCEALWKSLDEYERRLWDVHGCTLEQIQWYRDTLLSYGNKKRMAAEFPTDDVEAFVNTGSGVFSLDHVDELRKTCLPPLMKGELFGSALRGAGATEGIYFQPDDNGRFKVWSKPGDDCDGDRYVVTVDIGGRSEKSDYSVIAVIDRMGASGLPEVAAQWRGHIDHDLLAWKAATIASWYGTALLVIESNTLESEGTEGDHSGFILSELSMTYPNLYYRVMYDRISLQNDTRLGFHTNTSTKPLVVDCLIKMVNTRGYVERDEEACDELAVYEMKPGGSFGAKQGYHDDILMTRAIGLYVVSSTYYLPSESCVFTRRPPARWL